MTSNTSISLTGAMLHDAKRLGKIIAVFSKYGLGALFDRQKKNDLQDLRQNPASTAAKIRAAIEELGTTYIKFGQMLSTRSDLLPKEFIEELSRLQDNSPEMPFDVIEDILNEHYGDWHETFDSIDPKPLGSASIAQVHRARLKSGENVVVKVQRPALLPLIRSDVDILRALSRMLDNFIAEIAYFDLPALISEFERNVVEELDFGQERSNIEHFMEKYADNKMFVFPEPFPDLSCSNILVMRELEGQKITNIEPETETAHNMAQAILGLAFEMIFRDGIFHGDPHPGNVFATPDGKIALLDFGAVGHFSARQRNLLMRLILAANVGDCALMARTLLSLGHPTKRVVLEELENDISIILQRHLKTSLNNIDVAAFAHDFVSAGQKYAIRIPSEFSCAVRALLSIEGIIQYLEPKLDVMGTLSTYANRLLSEAFGKEGFRLNALQVGLNVTEFARSIPIQFSQIMQDLEYGGLAVRLPDNANDKLCNTINNSVTRVCLTLMIALFSVGSWFTNSPTLSVVCTVIGVIWCFVLIVWHYHGLAEKPKLKVQPYIDNMQRRKKWF